MSLNKKRSNGEGSITKRNDGRYMGQIMTGFDRHGKRIIKTIYAKTKKDVLQKLVEIKSEIYDGTYCEPNKITVSQWLKKWLNVYKSRSSRSQTKNLYRILINSIINSYMGTKKVVDIKPLYLQEFINHLVDHGYSYSTLEKIKNILKPALDMAVINKIIRENPFIKIQLPEKTEKDIRAFTREEQFNFEQLAKDNYYYEYFITGLNSGCRCCELLALLWNDINLEAGLMKINKTLIVDYDDMGKQFLRVQNVPKTKKSNRTLKLPEKVINLLIQLKNERHKTQFNDNNIVFCSKVGTYAYPKNVRRSMHLVCSKAGVTRAGTHVLRHTYATRLFEEKVDIKVVSESLGHARVDLTYNEYVHVFENSKIETANILDNLDLHKFDKVK